MSIAIKTSDNTYIYFDAVTRYSKVYNNSVTKHPIDGGGIITDHVTDENLSISVSGIISDADFGFNRPKLTLVNDLGKIDPVNVKNGTSKLSVFDVPNIFSKDKSSDAPLVIVNKENVSAVMSEVQKLLISLRDSKANKDTSKSLFSIIEFENGVMSGDAIDNCVFTSLDFSEDESTGTCLNITFTCEQVKFAEFRTTTIPKNVEAKLKDTAASKSDKGNQSKPSESVENPSPSAVTPPKRRSDLKERLNG